jgi:hypothetical protein
MRLRRLLAAGAAGLAPAGGYAADLVMAVEPVDYVGVCNAFGTGYIAIPGTDACLSIGGYIEFDAWVYDQTSVGNYFDAARFVAGVVTNPSNPLSDKTGVVAGPLYMTDDYKTDWGFSTEAKLVLDTKSQTDLGVVEAKLELEVLSDNDDDTGAGEWRVVYFDKGHGAIGPLLFGYTDSTFAWTDAGLSLDGAINADPVVDQIRLSHTAGPWTFAFALEDPRDFYEGAKNATGDYPNLAFAASGDWKDAFVQAALGVTDRTSGTGWGAQLSGQLGSGTSPQLQVNLAYAENAPVYVGGDNCTGSCDDEGAWWSAMVSGQVNLSKTLSVNSTVSYLEGPSYHEFEAALGTGWAATKTSLLSLEVLYSDEDGADSVGVHGQLKTTFGNSSN